MRKVALALVLSSCLTRAAAAQLVPALNSKPEAYAKPARVPEARDIPFPGTLQLTVDASDVTRGIFRVRERVPVTTTGDLVLLYPKWVPGGHSPRGDIKNVTGIRVSANGRPLKWVRASRDVFAFPVNVPQGARAFDVEFQYVSARQRTRAGWS